MTIEIVPESDNITLLKKDGEEWTRVAANENEIMQMIVELALEKDLQVIRL